MGLGGLKSCRANVGCCMSPEPGHHALRVVLVEIDTAPRSKLALLQ